MRIMYVGMDNRTRVSLVSSIKFLEGGFRNTDKQVEWDEGIKGHALVVHIHRAKGGKRLTMEVPPEFNLEQAKIKMLQDGWLDLTSCTVKTENLY